jgi:hypothetical protein
VFQARENALFSSFSLVAFSLASVSIIPSKGVGNAYASAKICSRDTCKFEMNECNSILNPCVTTSNLNLEECSDEENVNSTIYHILYFP